MKARWLRLLFNVFPAYRGTGARVTYIAEDFSEVRVKLPLSWRTRNYVGTIFGGSIYGAVDPMYMIMLIKLLGSDYIVWDKAASIRFRKPGRTTLFATFKIATGDGDNAPAVPAEALIREGDVATVWVEEEPKVFRRRPVKIGLEQDGHVQIREGVNVGERVVARGAIFVDNEWRTQ